MIRWLHRLGWFLHDCFARDERTILDHLRDLGV
jgi:hypothetical protein